MINAGSVRHEATMTLVLCEAALSRRRVSRLAWGCAGRSTTTASGRVRHTIVTACFDLPAGRSDHTGPRTEDVHLPSGAGADRPRESVRVPSPRPTARTEQTEVIVWVTRPKRN